MRRFAMTIFSVTQRCAWSQIKELKQTLFRVVQNSFASIKLNREYYTVARRYEFYVRVPKIAEDCRALSRKTRRCFNDTPTNLSTI